MTHLTHILSQVLSISMTYNGWISDAKDSFLGITTHFVDEFGKSCIECIRVKNIKGSHTSEVIVTVIKESLTQFNCPLMSQIIDIFMSPHSFFCNLFYFFIFVVLNLLILFIDFTL
jgi:hypothetical protein